VVADTSEFFASRMSDALLALLPGMSVFAPSVAETRLLRPEMEDTAAARWLAALGPRVLQKRGEVGALAVDGGTALAIPAPPTQVVDPTGAGDATVGALTALLAAGVAFPVAAVRALEAGAAAVSGIGPSALDFPLSCSATITSGRERE
jgi:sugar/nucleoside kinase (ribokinase family)